MPKYPFSTGWDDLMVNSFQVGVAGGPSRATFPAGTKCSAWSYANNVTERGLDFETQLPHGAVMNAQQPVYVHVHMSTTGITAAATEIGFLVQISMAKNLGAWVTKYYWCSYTPSVDLAAETQVMTVDVPLCAEHLALWEPSVFIKGTVFRHKGTLYATENAGNVTEAIDDVLWLHELDFHYFRNRAGSSVPQRPY
jgi:hypothetical protein